MVRVTLFRLSIAVALLAMAVSVDLMRPQSALTTAHVQKIDNPIHPANLIGKGLDCGDDVLRSV
jgi:hypothetical protein